MGKNDGSAAAPAAAPKTDAEVYMGEAMVELDRIRAQLTDKLALFERLPPMEKAMTSIAARIAEIDAKVVAQDGQLERLTVAVEQNHTKAMSRADKPMVFKGDSEFYATFNSRIGEEIRAAIRAEVGGLANQVYSAVDAHMKQNPIKMPTGSALVPLAAIAGAIASGIHLYMSYQAARAYVPADVRVAVNGVQVPHQTTQHAPAPFRSNGHPMVRTI